MKNTLRLLVACTLLGMSMMLPKSAQATQCTVNFDSTSGLQNIYQQARDTFAYFSAAGNTKCPTHWPNTDTGTCWDYRQPCAAGKNFTVVPQYYGHYHLSFSDPVLNSAPCFKNGGFARIINGVCTAPNWANEPRASAQPHTLGEWFEIASKATGSSAWGVFQLQTIRVGTVGPIQLWYETPDGSVWGWGSLAANTNWGVYTGDVVAVWVSEAQGSNVSFDIVDFVANH